MMSLGPGSGLFATSFENVSSAAVRSCAINSEIVRPAYDSFCFAHLPGFRESLLFGETSRISFPKELQRAVGRYDHVVFFFFDAFGWRSFERFRDSSPFLKAVDQDGFVLKTTSQFPSTTAVHVTTEVTGKPLFEHGVCGWDYYEPKVGRMIKPLRFSFSGDSDPGTLLAAGFEPKAVLPNPDILPSLIQRGVAVYTRGPGAYFPSPYNSAFCPQSSVCGYRSLVEGVDSVREVVESAPEKSYQSLYSDVYDVACHEQGVGSARSDSEALSVLLALEKFLSWKPPSPTLLIVSADHGHIATAPSGAISILSLMPNLRDYLKRDTHGDPIRFSGGPRSLCLHVKDDCVEQVGDDLRQRLAGAATVMTVPEACKAGLLGVPQVSEQLAERLGTLLVIPHRGYVVSWLEAPGFNEPPYSNHGGASPEEMETPLLLLPLR